MTPAVFTQHFLPIQSVRRDDGVLVLNALEKSVDWLNRAYVPMIEKALGGGVEIMPNPLL